MPHVRRFLLRIINVFRPGQAEPDLSRELASHLALLEDDFRRRGMTPEEAKLAAQRAFGGIEQTKERHRDMRSFVWIDDARRDVKHALRMLRRNPGFALLGVVVMALGIGANTAVFSVVNTVLLKPLPYQDPDRVVTLSKLTPTTPGAPFGSLAANVSLPDLADWRQQATGFEAMAFYFTRPRSVRIEEQAEYAVVSGTSPEFFRVFAAQPAAGRLFVDGDFTGGAVVVSDAFARSRLGGKEQAIGRTIRMLVVGNPIPRAIPVVGVLPAGFDFPRGTQIWLTNNPATNPARANRSQFNNLAIGRLKRGISLEQAQTEMSSVAVRLEQQYPESNKGRRVLVTPLQDAMVGDVRSMLYLLLAAVGLVLLIACANMATLLLARATTRAREVAVRAALGASRGRLARQMLAEGVLQGVVAGAAGLLLAVGGTRALVALAPGDVPRLSEVSVDGTVLAFTFIVSVVSSLLLALVPALQTSQIDVEQSLRQGATRSVSGGRTGRIRELLVVAQLAMAVMLLATGGLLVRSFIALQNVPLGFRPEGVLVTDATIANADPREDGTLFFRDLLAEVSRLPGVVAAGATMTPPGRIDSTGPYFLDNLPKAWMNDSGGQRPLTVMSVMSPSTFAALGVPIVSGRDFRDSDTLDAPRVAIVNEVLAREALPGQDIVGHTIFCPFDSADPMTVIGVVADIHQTGPSNAAQAECYLPYLQHAYNGATLSLVIRTAVEPTSLAESVRRKAQELSPAVPVKFTTLEALTARHMAAPRFRALLVGLFAAVALVLALVGVFGVMEYVVGQRTGEIGLRVALGATSGNIQRLLFGRGLALTAMGLAVGLTAAVAATRFIGSLLFQIEPTDPLTYAGVAALLGATSLLALYVPVRRATKVDPLIALRSE